MKLSYRKFFLTIFRLFFKELKFVNSDDILSLGKYKFIVQFFKSKFYRRKGFYALMPSESKIVCLNRFKIKGNLLNSRLIRSLISSRLYIQAINKVFIDSSVLIGPDVKIISANHSLENYEEWTPAKPIYINKNVWIGANSVILPGVNLGSNCIVGAGSVVTKSFEENSVIAGVPARLIGKNKY